MFHKASEKYEKSFKLWDITRKDNKHYKLSGLLATANKKTTQVANVVDAVGEVYVDE